MAALFITTFLTFASQTNNIWAGESYKVNNTVEKIMKLHVKMMKP